MISFQIQNIKSCLAWLETCPHKFTITSMQGGFVHVKFFVSEESLSQYGNKEIMEALDDTKIQT